MRSLFQVKNPFVFANYLNIFQPFNSFMKYIGLNTLGHLEFTLLISIYCSVSAVNQSVEDRALTLAPCLGWVRSHLQIPSSRCPLTARSKHIFEVKLVN